MCSMKINADVYVKDIPGQLVASLEPISTFDGNIIGVVHNREQVISGKILVNIIFDISAENLELLKKEWKARDVVIVNMGEAVENYSMDYMLVGKLNASDIDDIINEISESMEMESVEVGYSASGSKDSRTAMVSVTVRSVNDLRKLDSYFSERTKNAGLTYIRGVDA